MKISINRNFTENAPGPNFEIVNNNRNETDFWIGNYKHEQLTKSISGYNLILSKTIKINNFKLSPDVSLGPGVKVEKEFVTFSCSYSLKPTTVIQTHDVIGADVNITRSALGHLDYQIQFENSSHVIGESVKFRIIPTNPGLVFSRIKSCTMTHSLNQHLKYNLFWPMKLIDQSGGRLRRDLIGQTHFCKDKIVDFNILSEFQSKYTQIFEFTSFKWNLDSMIDSHILKCDLELSYKKFEENQPKYCNKLI